MSWSIGFRVVDGKVDPDSLSVSGAPDGSYSVNGHVHHPGADAPPSVSVSTPMGGVSAYLSDQAIAPAG